VGGGAAARGRPRARGARGASRARAAAAPPPAPPRARRRGAAARPPRPAASPHCFCRMLSAMAASASRDRLQPTRGAPRAPPHDCYTNLGPSARDRGRPGVRAGPGVSATRGGGGGGGGGQEVGEWGSGGKRCGVAATDAIGWPARRRCRPAERRRRRAAHCCGRHAQAPRAPRPTAAHWRGAAARAAQCRGRRAGAPLPCRDRAGDLRAGGLGVGAGSAIAAPCPAPTPTPPQPTPPAASPTPCGHPAAVGSRGGRRPAPAPRCAASASASCGAARRAARATAGGRRCAAGGYKPGDPPCTPTYAPQQKPRARGT
jgi:hypothetical protein